MEILEAARRIRPEMRIVVTSAYSKEMGDAALGLQVHNFVRKPFRLSDLMRLLTEPVSTE